MAQTSSQTSSAPSLSRADIDRAYEAVQRYLNVLAAVQSFLADFTLYRRELREDIREALDSLASPVFSTLPASGRISIFLHQSAPVTTLKAGAEMLEGIRRHLDGLASTDEWQGLDKAWDERCERAIESFRRWNDADQVAREKRPSFRDIENALGRARRDVQHYWVLQNLRTSLSLAFHDAHAPYWSRIVARWLGELAALLMPLDFWETCDQAIRDFLDLPDNAPPYGCLEAIPHAAGWRLLLARVQAWLAQADDCEPIDSPQRDDDNAPDGRPGITRALQRLSGMSPLDACECVDRWNATLAGWRQTAADEYNRLLADANGQLRLAADPPEPSTADNAGSMAPAAKGNGSEGENGQESTTDPPLDARAQEVLTAMLDTQAFDADARQTTDEITKKASGTDPAQFKHVLADLKKRGYVESHRGRSGGYWLTSSGRTRADKIVKGGKR
ncbi:MAG: Rrf2 family transcriptional regulator [Pirellulales bacterium]